MQYWRGGKQTTKETPQAPSPFQLATGYAKGSPGPERKLRLEQEFLLTLMKLFHLVLGSYTLKSDALLTALNVL